MSLEGIRAFLETNNDGSIYEQTGRCGRGMIRRYIEKMAGVSRATVSRMITQYLHEGEEVKLKAFRRRKFPTWYTRQDIELLASSRCGARDLSRSGF